MRVKPARERQLALRKFEHRAADKAVFKALELDMPRGYLQHVQSAPAGRLGYAAVSRYNRALVDNADAALGLALCDVYLFKLRGVLKRGPCRDVEPVEKEAAGYAGVERAVAGIALRRPGRGEKLESPIC